MASQTASCKSFDYFLFVRIREMYYIIVYKRCFSKILCFDELESVYIIQDGLRGYSAQILDCAQVDKLHLSRHHRTASYTFHVYIINYTILHKIVIMHLGFVVLGILIKIKGL